MTTLFSLKMRASRQQHGRPVHISGAERIVAAEAAEQMAAQLLRRAMTHPKGAPDSIHLKVEALDRDSIRLLPPLPVTTVETATAAQGLRQAARLLAASGVPGGEAVIARLPETYGMRGAMLLDCRTGARLEPDHARGVRATYMDYAAGGGSGLKGAGANTHFREALVLATKVVSHPYIRAELCVSDDPDYVTGYVASKALGYVRLTNLKEKGDPRGGRIFLYDGPGDGVADCIAYLERQPVLIGEAEQDG